MPELDATDASQRQFGFGQQQFASSSTTNVQRSLEGIQEQSVFSQITPCPTMAEDIANIYGDKDDPATLIQSFCLVEFECKSEPCIDLANSVDENLLTFDESTPLHVPVSIPMIKNPIVMLERCDKIWETLKLIKVVQTKKPTTLIDCDKNEKEEKEEKEQYVDKIKKSSLYFKNQFRISDNTVPPPFKFSVQRSRKLYHCTICGKQYMERRSLRKHSERVHRVVIPLLRERFKYTTIKKRNEATSVISVNKESGSSQFSKESSSSQFSKESSSSHFSKESSSSQFSNKQLYNNKESYEKITTKITTKSKRNSGIRTWRGYIKCALCKREVACLKNHLIFYHKISGSAVKEQLDSSLNKTKSSKNETTTLTNKSHQDGYRIMDNDNKSCERVQIKRKTNYTPTNLLQTNARKKLKLSNEHDEFVQNLPIKQKQILTDGPFKCDICLGWYSTIYSFTKHRRIHKSRGETKENFHKFQCRYFNSPLNEKFESYVKTKPSTADTVAMNISNKLNESNTLQLNKSKRNTLFNQTSKIRATRYNEKMKKNNETTCICGRLFRNPHTLFIHKKNCELCQNEDIITQNTRVSSDRDSGIGINITIKKRNDSYEIVGKDDEEDKSQTSETSSFKDDILSHTSNYIKDSTITSTKQQVSDTSEFTNNVNHRQYSKDHSILKLQDTDEDIIIDIEDDVQISLNEDDTTEQVITPQDDKEDSSEQQNNDAKEEKIGKDFNKVTTLKQMCEEVLEMHKTRNIENNNTAREEHKKYSQIKDQETCKENSQIKNQEIHEENKRKLRSNQYSRMELDHSYDRKEINMTQFHLSMCGYCKESFKTIKSYDNHQCTVKLGKPFDKFSLQLQCFCCKEILDSYKEFDEHVRIKHFDSMYHCYFCPERFPDNRARLYHFRTEHNDLACRFCNKNISIATKALHEAYHLGFGSPCHKCKKAYINNKNLYHHKQAVHSNWADNLVTCTICLKCIKIKTLRSHMAGHKQNACHFCGKIFSDRIGIEYHTMMHHGTNTKLKCNICGTRFHTKKQIEMHEKIDGCNNIHGIKKEAAITEHVGDD